jgi:hypothetical protein
MLKTSGKTVHFLRTVQGIASVRLSTVQWMERTTNHYNSEQLGFTPILSTVFHWAYPLLKSHFSPPSEHYLYPVSTAPTISPSQKKI